MIAAYPGDLLVDEKDPIDLILSQARNLALGDTLFSFVLLELADVIGSMDDDLEARTEARRAMGRAIEDIKCARVGIR